MLFLGHLLSFTWSLLREGAHYGRPHRGIAEGIEPEFADPPTEAERLRREALGHHLGTLLTAIARADGRATVEERERTAQAIAHHAGVDSNSVAAVLRAVEGASHTTGTLEQAAAGCVRELTAAERLLVLDALYAVALADGEVDRKEQGAIRRVAQLLELPAAAQRSALARNRGAIALCYEILGVPPSASDAEVKDAYLRLSTLTDPEALRLGDGARLSARERREQVELAYAEIRQLRGL